MFVLCQCLGNPVIAQTDPFLVKLYDSLNMSPLQQKFRALSPMPIGVVYVQRQGEGEQQMREHFRQMKELGFNCLKQVMVIPGWTIEQVQMIALEEGIIPWWYGEGGWEELTPDLMKELGIASNLPVAEARAHPKMIAYQNALMKKRIEKTIQHLNATGEALKGHSTAYEPELGGRGFDLTELGKKLFLEWVRDKYKTVENLNHSWNQYHVGLQPSGSNIPFQSWQDFSGRYSKLSNNEYNHLKDILTFKVQHSVASIRKRCEYFREFDPHAVFRGGGEIGLFHPLAYYGVNMESIASLMKDYGSFYPSIHFAWHYAETKYEIARPMYMQAALANDFFKGGWSATWESTGGPQQFSGGKGGAYFTVDGGTITQFLLSQLAAGFKGWGTWCWSVRTAGWEAGEYGLLDRNNQITDRAILAGLIGKRANELRDEIWDLRKEPLVGVLYDWESEAMWASMSAAGRDEFKELPIQSRIGISRALINANVPFEYVMSNDLRKGLAGRYRVIYLPAILSLNEDLIPILKKYVEQGGRVVLDAPTGYYNQNGSLLNTRKGSDFEKLFGVVVNDYQGAGVNRAVQLEDIELHGLIMDVTNTSAKTLMKYASGRTAVTENYLGKGQAVILGYEASSLVAQPNQTNAEKILLRHALGNLKPDFQCEGAIVYRLAGEASDHYFLINDGPATQVSLRFNHDRYVKVKDVISDRELSLNTPVRINANTGLWLRFEKR